MTPRAYTCPTCNAGPMVACRRVIEFGRSLTRDEMLKLIGSNADGEPILDEPAGVIHIERANMANKAEKAGTCAPDRDWNVAALYAEKVAPEPDRGSRGGKQTMIIGGGGE